MASDGFDELETALLVALVIDPGLDITGARRTCDAFFDLAPAAADPQALLTWLREQGFGRAVQGNVTLAHSSLPWVLAHREGIPISLSVILMAAARHRGLEAYGINYPGHFLARIGDLLVDPLTMSALEGDDAPALDPRQRATPRALGLRMLNNLKALHMQRRDWSAALDIIDYQMSLCEGAEAELSASLHYERGELWQQLGSRDMARSAFRMCASLSADDDLAARARARAAEHDDNPPTQWH